MHAYRTAPAGAVGPSGGSRCPLRRFISLAKHEVHLFVGDFFFFFGAEDKREPVCVAGT